MQEITRPYEGVIIVDGDATEKTQKALFRKNKKIIEDYSGTVNSLDTWGKRKLGNPIKKKNQAFYFYTTFSANNEAVAELERTMRINDNVLRFMHMRLKDGTDLKQHLEKFKETIAAAHAKEKEFEMKEKKRKERFSKQKERKSVRS